MDNSTPSVPTSSWSTICTNQLPDWASSPITPTTLNKIKEKFEQLTKPEYDCVVTNRQTFSAIAPYFSETSSSPWSELGKLPIHICLDTEEAEHRYKLLLAEGKSPLLFLVPAEPEIPAWLNTDSILPREIADKYKGRLQEINASGYAPDIIFQIDYFGSELHKEAIKQGDLPIAYSG
jgi:hypothetical protein